MIDSLEELRTLRTVEKTAVYPRAGEVPMVPVCINDPKFYLEDDPVLRMHLSRCQQVDLALFRLQDVILQDVNQVFVDGQLLSARDIFAPYIRAHFEAQNPTLDLSRPVRTIETPCLYGVSWYSHAYGHKLLEIIPKLHVFLKSRYSATDFTIVVPEHLRSSIRFVLDIFGIEQRHVCYYDITSENLHFRDVVMCGDFRLRHPCASLIFDEVYENTTSRSRRHKQDSAGPYVYVTRSMFRSRHNRPLGRFLNEPECVEILKRLGFVVISPEGLSFGEQLDIFSNLRVCIGECGSALHNGVVSRAGSVYGVVGYINSVQTEIASIRGSKIAYLRQFDQLANGDFRVDTELFAEFAARVVSA